MQCIVVAGGAPVAAVKYVVALKKNCRRDDFLALFCENGKNLVRQRGTDLNEEIQVEIGQRTAPHECDADQPVQNVPEIRIDVAALNVAKRDSGFLNAAAFAPHFLALGGTEGREKFVEIAVAVIVPVKLAVLADPQAGVTQLRQFPLVGEQNV